ncbi:NCA2-domain-containing protein [Gloeophyllum trabeum ATCC 11539]|uniref:NCA2-domain-containing protein n=1 Tax=Gloeophyllum trabeum (strain ATCC 11539 / FP-39264 / Madison 617) TaxID=670483 RepID=S7RNW7_GLOTA|nr:NCA2-domain-containing protein [Gloeophyllum trabeum ATCC 11539]EPQ54469.1 NCA2-domain-containing protein [Gloeophyllum trabeum ATCC 11539]
MSTFVAQQTDGLILSTFPGNAFAVQSTVTARTEHLNALLLALKPPLSPDTLRDTVEGLQRLESETDGAEDAAIRIAVLGRLTVGVYAQALSAYLEQASEAEAEAEWWSDIERSRLDAARYLLQTLPVRLASLARTVVHTIRSESHSLSTRQVTPSSVLHTLRSLAHSASPLRPNLLTTSLFPHLHTDPHLLTSLSLPLPTSVSTASLRTTLTTWLHTILHTLTLPISLTHQECTLKRQQLDKIRNEKAERLGALSGMRPQLEKALKDGDEAELTSFVTAMQSLVVPTASPSAQALAASLSTLTAYTPAPVPAALRRPPRLTLLWPRLVLGPPLALFAVRRLYASRASLTELAGQAADTLRGFWQGWVLEPVRDIVRTVRAGGEGGVIVRKEGVEADLQSLERMVVALARDKLGYGAQQLDALAGKVRVGDLTPVMEIYEEDIKSPIRSAVAGTLVRSLFVQVQKAKVDIDQALSGIDKLLKSQELTFAFVGVAPALAVVYGAAGALLRVWTGGRGRGRFGGAQRRAGVLGDVRRVERLLIFQPKGASARPDGEGQEIPPLTTGLLLLSLTRLRRYAETHLPRGSRLREGFLEDVRDLEDPLLGRREKLRVVERMWRCWGGLLGWGEVSA